MIMGKKDELGFGIIGCGVVGPWHADAIRKTAGAKLVAVADALEERAKALGTKYVVPWYSDYHELLRRADVDVVNICVPSGMHTEVVIAAAEAGKHILCEKPIDITLEKADAMIKAAGAAGVRLGIIFQSRFKSGSRMLKRAIEGGKLGRLILCDAYLKYYRTQEYYDSGQWRGTWALDGGGCLMNQGIHGIDLLQWLAGPVESVEAYMGIFAHERIEVEDIAIALLKFKSGAIGVIEGSTAAYPGFPTVHEIHGTNGSVRLEDGIIKGWDFIDALAEDKDVVRQFQEEEAKIDRSDPAAVIGESHRPQIEDMVAAIKEDREPAVNGEEGRKSVEIILGIYKSAREGKPVAFPL